MPDEPPSRAEFDERLRALNARREVERRENAREGAARTDWGLAVKLSSEFIAAVIVGGLLGFGFDWAFGTTPWGLIAFFMLGFAAAILNVLRSVGRAPASRLNIEAVDRAATTAKPRDGDPGGG